MAFQYEVLLVMVSIFPKLTSFKKEQFVLVSPVLSLLEASSGNKLRKSITTSNKGPLVDLLLLSKTRLLRNRGPSYVLPQIRNERFKRWFINRYLFSFIELSIVIQNVFFFSELIKSFI